MMDKKIVGIQRSLTSPIVEQSNRDIMRIRNLALDQQEKLNRELAEKKEREIDNHRNLQRTADNTDRVVEIMVNTHDILIIIDNLLRKNNLNQTEILNQVEQPKNIDAEIFSLLAKSDISTENGRNITAGDLTKLTKSGIEVSAALTTIMMYISGL